MSDTQYCEDCANSMAGSEAGLERCKEYSYDFNANKRARRGTDIRFTFCDNVREFDEKGDTCSKFKPK